MLQLQLRAYANHTGDRYYNLWNLFCAYVVPNKKYLNQVEGILIAAMPSAQNSSTPWMH